MKSISEWSMIDHHVKWASFMIIIKIVVLITLCQGLYESTCWLFEWKKRVVVKPNRDSQRWLVVVYWQWVGS